VWDDRGDERAICEESLKASQRREGEDARRFAALVLSIKKKAKKKHRKKGGINIIDTES